MEKINDWYSAPNSRLSWLGKERDRESGLGDHGVRKYDNDGGRFLSVDPLWEKYYAWTPYHYCGNDPVNKKDENGKLMNVVAGAAIGVTVEYGFQVWNNFQENPDISVFDALTNIKPGKIILAGVFGAVTGGVSALESTTAKLALAPIVSVAESASKKAAYGETYTGANMAYDAVSSLAFAGIGELTSDLLKKTATSQVLKKGVEGAETVLEKTAKATNTVKQQLANDSYLNHLNEYNKSITPPKVYDCISKIVETTFGNIYNK